MTSNDLAVIVRSVAPVMREYVAASLVDLKLELVSAKREITELMVRLAAAEQRAMTPGAKGEPGRDGISVKVEDVAQMVSAEVQKAVAALPVPRDGKNATVDLEALVTHVVSLVPKGEPGQAGRSVTVEDVAPMVSAEVMKAVAALPKAKDGEPGKPGESVDMTQVEALVTKVVAALPAPKDGCSVTVEDVAPLITAEVAKAVGQVPVPKDGTGLTGAVLDRAGHLLLTLSDGSLKDVGCVVGRDAELAEVQRVVSAELEKWPRPKDGAPGTPGRDGTLENLKIQRVDERTIQFAFKNGDPIDGGLVKNDTVLYRGVFVDGQTYEAGDCVTYGGHTWIAKATTSAKPDEHVAEGRRDWTMAVRRGRDGKQGPPGLKGIDGKPGTNGRDLTHISPDGQKW